MKVSTERVKHWQQKLVIIIKSVDGGVYSRDSTLK